MRKLMVFNQVSLDGYFVDKRGDMSWAHKSDPEWDAFVAGNASGQAHLLFGRKTYEMMASYWPSPAAKRDAPEVAKGMNDLPKVVFSRTLKSADWSHTRLVRDDLVGEVRKLKAAQGPDLLIMGSGTIISQLTQAALIDEYQLVVNPIVLGAGRTLFEGLDGKLALERLDTRTFKNGNVVMSYVPR